MTASYTTAPTAPAPKKQAWWKKPSALIVGFGLACTLVGVGIGSADTPEPKTVEVIKEVPGPERIVTKNVEVKVPTTPDSCIAALSINELAFTLLSESLGHVIDGNYAAANASSEKVKALVPKVNAVKADCRASK